MYHAPEYEINQLISTPEARGWSIQSHLGNEFSNCSSSQIGRIFCYNPPAPALAPSKHPVGNASQARHDFVAAVGGLLKKTNASLETACQDGAPAERPALRNGCSSNRPTRFSRRPICYCMHAACTPGRSFCQRRRCRSRLNFKSVGDWRKPQGIA